MLTPDVECRADGKVTASVACRLCGRVHRMVFDESRFDRVLSGEHVQDVFPDMSPADRELFFISGTCGSCWDDIFGNREE